MVPLENKVSPPSELGVQYFGAIRCTVRPEEPQILVFAYQNGFTIADFQAAMRHVVDYSAVHAPIAILSEVRGTAPAGAGERRRMVEIVNQADEVSGRRICASAVVTDSALMRGVLTAVSWVHSPPYPLRPFADDQEARRWLRERLAAATAWQR